MDYKGIAYVFENFFQFLSAQASAYNGALEMPSISQIGFISE
jgi:hypothetical protein